VTWFPIARFALANFRARKVRFTLTILAVAISVAMVVSITSGYASFERGIRIFVEDFIGTVDFEVTRPDDPRPAIPPDLVQAMRDDPRVAKVTTRIEVFATPIDSRGVPIQAARAMLYGIGDDPSSLGRTPRMDEGRFLKPGERDAIVVDRNLLENLKAKLGDTVTFDGRGASMQLKIIGVVHRPAMMRMFFRSAYVAQEQVGEFVAPDRKGHISKIRGEFRTEVDAAAFSEYWQNRLSHLDEKYQFTLVRESRAELDKNLLGIRLASYLGSTVALSAAAFIILASLMTGVQEQHRQLAMLRAIGATRWQVGRLVCGEGVWVGFTGALVGIPLGIAGLYLLATLFPDIFDSGVVLAPMGMVYAMAVACLAALVASAIPAWWASRAKPMEAMSSATTADGAGRLPYKAIFIGLVLSMVDTLIIFGPVEPLLRAIGINDAQHHAREVRLYAHFFIGLPCLLIGALLFAPLLVRVVELTGNLIVPHLLRLPTALLKQQLTESPWRSAATGVAMMIGMMMLITMNAQGRSALEAWKLPTRFPDVFIIPDASYGAMSIKPQEIQTIRELPQVEPGQVMPISVTAPTLGAQIFDIAGTAMPDKTLFIGIDPTLAFDMMELDFRDGDEATARRMLIRGQAMTLDDGTVLHGTIEQQDTQSITLLPIAGPARVVARDDIRSQESGRYLVVTDEFRKLRGYKTGDSFSLESGLLIRSNTEFVIVGVVWSPGLDVMLNSFDLPARVKEQTAATVFGSLEDAQGVFGVRDAFLIAARLKLGVERQDLVDQMRIALGREGLNVADVRQVKHDIESMFKNLLFFASTVAWLAMGVATLGVGNAIVAGIRTRQWRLGVLRAVGLTRSELLRLLLGEAVLLAIVGIVLGTGFGLLLAMNARHLYSLALGFDPPAVIPWDMIGLASAVVILLSLLATIVPAASTARREPLALLQAGRAAN
jgi:putative ABC transport system permease protein